MHLLNEVLQRYLRRLADGHKIELNRNFDKDFCINKCI